MKRIRLKAEGVTIRLNIGGEFVYLESPGQEVTVTDEDFHFLRDQIDSIPVGLIEVIEVNEAGSEEQKEEEGQGGRRRRKD